MGFKILRADDLTSLWYQVTRWHLYKKEVDLELGIGTNLNNVILEADSAEYDFDLQEVWLNPQRWTRLTREYLDGPELSDFIRRSRVILSGKGSDGVITNFHFKGVTRSDRKHKWGNCLLAATFRGSPKKRGRVTPTLTLHSRVSYNAYMLGLDMGLAHTMTRYITSGSGLDPSDIRIQWHLDVMQLHSFKCLPYLYTQPDLMERLELAKVPPGVEDRGYDRGRLKEYPTWKSILRWWDKVQEFHGTKPVEDEKYGPFKRIRRRYEEYLREEYVPSTPIDTLDFMKVEGFEHGPLG